MARKLKSDRLLFTATLLLLVISIAWVYSASVVQAEQRFGDPGRFLVRQLLWVALGLAFMLSAMRLDYHWYRNQRLLWGLFGATVVALVAVFLSPPVNHAHRWLNLYGLGIQPSELAKLVTILFVAMAVDRRVEQQDALPPGLVKVGLVLAVFGALIWREPDAGSATALCAIACAMLFVAGIAYKWVLAAGGTALPVMGLLLWAAPYRRARIFAFLDPSADPQGIGFQIRQSLLAVGGGGVWGKGFMQGVQKMFYLPEAQSDFIYAVIAEERGLIGATVVLICFAVIIWRGLVVARQAPDAFGSLVALGITMMIGLQALVNISVVIGLMPAKGIPLPFVSAGGSSMAISLVAMGILLNISQQASAIYEGG
ncbi:MAG TPA: putative lipid II flippase FtsW [Vicinamibacterales bacterium]|jgi:cell division protein FtsW